jgi:DNA invertase Pin-like site-specific DNA recombinase
MHILAALAQFEKERIRERVMAGLQRAKAQGKRLGRPTNALPLDSLASVAQLSLTDGAISLWNLPLNAQALEAGSQIPLASREGFACSPRPFWPQQT